MARGRSAPRRPTGGAPRRSAGSEPPTLCWLGWLAAEDRPLAFVLEPGQDAREVARQAHTIGYDQLLGALTGDVDAWRAAALPLDSTELVDVRTIDRPVLDVRQENEYAAGH